MTHARAKAVAAGVVLVGAVGYLVYAGVKKGQSYYLEVDRFVTGKQYHNGHVRLHGTVSEEDLQVDGNGMQAAFTLCGREQQVRVAYEGVIPEMFESGRQVVVEGRLGEEGVFQATELLTKCASKYEGKPASAGSGGAS